jgi:hypothetical protein
MIIRRFIEELNKLQDKLGDIFGATAIRFVTKDGQILYAMSLTIEKTENGSYYIAVNIV